uniref:SERPIN domain-containing protein n=1 Tax=Caenorhabditis tropicalis TaxID=1561998 RepID=A0A1I7TAQ0_9PELO
MDPISVATFTFGLKTIQELGVSGSLVFSPILLLLSSFSKNRISFNMDKDQVSKLIDISKNEFRIENDLNLMNTTLHATWKYHFIKHHRSRLNFYTDNGKMKELKYVSADKSLSEQLVSDNIGFRVSQDDVLSVLQIPLVGDSLSFMIFLPKKDFYLKESLEKLDSNRMESLLDQMSVFNVHFKIPFFQMSSVIDTGKLLNMKLSNFHKFRFEWRIPSKDHFEDNEDFGESFIKRPPDRTPYNFIANRPFFYAIFKDDAIPILMGCYTGS